jgi:hypothetical protein
MSVQYEVKTLRLRCKFIRISGGRKVMIHSRLFRLAAILLVPALLTNNFAFAAKKPADPAAIKAKIQARGVGQGVRITLIDQTDVKGTIVAIGDQSFALKAKKGSGPQEYEYAQITGVHNDRLTRGQKVGIAVGIVAGFIIVVAVVLTKSFDHAKF